MLTSRTSTWAMDMLGAGSSKFSSYPTIAACAAEIWD
jgi:hypothetical protein